MLTVPFLTDLDSRAAVKGSRDPLGIQSIWTRLGRQVVGNLTTVSDSVRDFAVLLLGYYFAEKLAQESGPGTELATFLRWEQLAAYARASVNDEQGFRGTERVRKNLSEGSRVTISDDRAHQILGNQKIYGLWGLYTMPARASELLDGDPTRLTPPALEFVEKRYLPILADGGGRAANRILDVLRPHSRKVDVKGADRRIMEAVAKVLSRRLPAPDREFYRTHLLHGGPRDTTGGLQQQLAALVENTLTIRGFAWSPSVIAALVKEARLQGETGHPLAHRLERIRTAESVLAPMAALFTHLLGLEGAKTGLIADRLRETWGDKLTTVDVGAFRELRTEIGGGVPEVGDRWVAIAETSAQGHYGELVERLIEQNAWVMSQRGGVPWVEKRGGRFHVRFRDEQGTLPARTRLPDLWRFPYFLDSLRNVASALREPSHD